MEIFFFIVIAVLVVGTVWNRKNAAAAMAGVEFRVDASPERVVRIFSSAFCDSKKAKLTAAVGAVRVEPAGKATFKTTTRIGDEGQVTVVSDGNDGAVVRSFAEELYVGTHPSGHFRRGFANFGAQMAHGIYKVLGIAPNAGKMKRFNAALERRVLKEVARVGA